MLENELREAALGHEIGDDLAGVRKEQIGTVGTDHGAHFLFGKTDDAEDARLLDLDDKGRLVPELCRDGHGEHDLEKVVLDPIDLGADIELMRGLPLTAKDVR